MDEPLLSPVMKIANHPPTLFIRGSHDAGAGSGQILASIDVGDRGRDQLGELADSNLGARWERVVLCRVDGQPAPQLPLDDDRGADG